MADDPQTDRKWHLDRRVPLALILTIIGQTSIGVWWAATTNERVSTLERASLESAKTTPVQADRLTRVESKMESVQRDLTEIKSDVKSLLRSSPLR
jgi:hypothetical protein